MVLTEGLQNKTPVFCQGFLQAGVQDFAADEFHQSVDQDGPCCVSKHALFSTVNEEGYNPGQGHRLDELEAKDAGLGKATCLCGEIK